MIINKLYLKKFGKFENKEIEFSDGLNIISGKNESGKSTIATALKAFFYTDLTGKGKYKKNYIPLSEDKGLFDVSFTLDDSSRLKSLVTLGKTNGKTLVKTIVEETGEELESKASQNGERFFLLSEEMFDSVCYIKDLNAVSNLTENKNDIHDKLSKTENNIIDIDLSNVIKKVKDELTLLQRKTSSGKIYPLEKKLEEINKSLADLKHIREALNETDAKITDLCKKETLLKETLEDIAKKEEYLNKYKDYEHTKEQLKLRKEIASLKKNSEGKGIAFKEIPAIELEKIRRLSSACNREEKNIVMPLAAAIVCVITGIALSFVNIIFGALSLISAPLFMACYKALKTNRIIKKEKEEYLRLLCEYEISGPKEYDLKKEEYLKQETERKLTEQKAEFLSAKLSDYNKEYEEIYLSSPSYTKESLNSRKEDVAKQLTETAIEKNTLSEKKKSAFNNMPDYHMLCEEKDELTKQIEKLKEEESVVADCLNILNITNNSFKSSYIPYLSRETKNILSAVMGKDLDYFNINDEFLCEIRREGEDQIIPKDNFSRGTDALIYFALRLAIHKLISKGEKIPLILDDCFLELDDERFKKILEYLSKNADCQVVYFTAHERIFNLTLANTTVFRL